MDFIEIKINNNCCVISLDIHFDLVVDQMFQRLQKWFLDNLDEETNEILYEHHL